MMQEVQKQTRRQRHRAAQAWTRARQAAHDACRAGDLDRLVSLRTHTPYVLSRPGDFYPESPWYAAGEAGHWHVLQWGWKDPSGPNPDVGLLYTIAECGGKQDRYDKLLWFAAHGAALNWFQAFGAAAAECQWMTLEFCRSRLSSADLEVIRTNARFISYACAEGRVDVCDWYRTQGLITMTETSLQQLYETAAAHRQLAVMDWLWQHYGDYPYFVDPSEPSLTPTSVHARLSGAVRNALAKGDWDVVAWCEARGWTPTAATARPRLYLWEAVVRNKQRASVEWLFAHEMDGPTWSFEPAALSFSVLDSYDFEWIKWWCQHPRSRSVFCSYHMTAAVYHETASLRSAGRTPDDQATPWDRSCSTTCREQATQTTLIREWLELQGALTPSCRPDLRTFEAAVQGNRLSLLARWERAEWLTPEVVVRAVKHRAWDSLGWLLYRGAPWSQHATEALWRYPEPASNSLYGASSLYWRNWAYAHYPEQFPVALTTVAKSAVETRRSHRRRRCSYQVATSLWLWQHHLDSPLRAPLDILETQILMLTRELPRRVTLLRELAALKPLRAKSQRILAGANISRR